jgi:hypothetical protein
VFWA